MLTGSCSSADMGWPQLVSFAPGKLDLVLGHRLSSSLFYFHSKVQVKNAATIIPGARLRWWFSG